MNNMKSVKNNTDVNTMRQRLQKLEVNEVEDIAVLKQYVEDSSLNIFPQYYLTELPYLVIYAVQKGKIAVLLDRSTSTFIAPSTFFSFLESSEVLYMRCIVCSILCTLLIIVMCI